MELSPNDFLAKLSTDSVTLPIVLHGMAKHDPSLTEAFLLAIHGNCDQWLKIPVSIISSIEVVGRRRCADHDHVLVRVTLAVPTDSNPLVDLLWELAQSNQSHASAPIPDREFDRDRPRRCPTGWYTAEVDAKCKGSGAWGHGTGRSRNRQQAWQDAYVNAMWNAGCSPGWEDWSELKWVGPSTEYEPCD